MTLRGLTRDKLLAYCREHEISVPSSASKEQIEAAIARAYLHLQEAKPGKFGCFGYWDGEDQNCHRFCKYREECLKSSVGMSMKQYKRHEKTVDRLRFAEPIRKKRR